MKLKPWLGLGYGETPDEIVFALAEKPCPDPGCGPKKAWDSEKCECVCANPQPDCGKLDESGFAVFDAETCDCKCPLVILCPGNLGPSTGGLPCCDGAALFVTPNLVGGGVSAQQNFQCLPVQGECPPNAISCFPTIPECLDFCGCDKCVCDCDPVPSCTAPFKANLAYCDCRCDVGQLNCQPPFVADENLCECVFGDDVASSSSSSSCDGTKYNISFGLETHELCCPKDSPNIKQTSSSGPLTCDGLLVQDQFINYCFECASGGGGGGGTSSSSSGYWFYCVRLKNTSSSSSGNGGGSGGGLGACCGEAIEGGWVCLGDDYSEQECLGMGGVSQTAFYSGMTCEACDAVPFRSLSDDLISIPVEEFDPAIHELVSGPFNSSEVTSCSGGSDNPSNPGSSSSSGSGGDGGDGGDGGERSSSSSEESYLCVRQRPTSMPMDSSSSSSYSDDSFCVPASNFNLESMELISGPYDEFDRCVDNCSVRSSSSSSIEGSSSTTESSSSSSSSSSADHSSSSSGSSSSSSSSSDDSSDCSHYIECGCIVHINGYCMYASCGAGEEFDCIACQCKSVEGDGGGVSSSSTGGPGPVISSSSSSGGGGSGDGGGGDGGGGDGGGGDGGGGDGGGGDGGGGSSSSSSIDCSGYLVAMPICSEFNEDCIYVTEQYENGCPKTYGCGCFVDGECGPCQGVSSSSTGGPGPVISSSSSSGGGGSGDGGGGDGGGGDGGTSNGSSSSSSSSSGVSEGSSSTGGPGPVISSSSSSFEYDPNKLALVYDTSKEPLNNTVSLPLAGTVDVVVNWGDGSTNNYVTPGLKTHTYANPGIYVVQVSGSITGLDYGVGNSTTNNKRKLVRCLSFGNIGLTSLQRAFRGCSNLVQCPTSIPSGVYDLSETFRDCSSFVGHEISSWDTMTITDMRGMFVNCTSLDVDVSAWSVALVADMANMFYNCSLFNSDLSFWSVDSVTNMSNMFYNTDLYSSDMGTWNLSGLDANNRLDNFMTSATGLTTSDYDATLIGWEENKSSFRNDLRPNFGGSKYTSGSPAAAARAALVTYGWTITDGGAA